MSFIANAQDAPDKPKWLFGTSAGVNFNKYLGMTQKLNSGLTSGSAFKEGRGVKPYVSILTEYRHSKKWGGMLNLAFDNRGGTFDANIVSSHAEKLSTNISYIVIEPSLRLEPFTYSSFYLFGGPTFSINVDKQFHYEDKGGDVLGRWDNMRKTMLAFQWGAGIDLSLTDKTFLTQLIISPFITYQTNFGHEPRLTESWYLHSIRAGVMFKIGM